MFEIDHNSVSHLNKPIAVWSNPEKKVAVNTNLRYNVGFSSAETVSSMVAAISREQAATVPTARCFELPNTAYINGGTKLESTTYTQNV